MTQMPTDLERQATSPPARNLGPWKRHAFCLAPFVAFLALLFGVEAAVRAILPRLDGLDVFVRSPLQRHDLADRRHVRIFIGDPLVFWRLKPSLCRVIWDYTLVSTNAQGLRHDDPIGRKPRDGFRIVCLGDSVTFGYRVPTVWPDRPADYDPNALPYAALLERWLRAVNPGRAIDVVPLAIPGHSSHQGRALLEREIDGLEPDVVTICYGWNDVNVRESPDKESMPIDGWSALRRGLISRSQILLRVAAWLQSRRTSPRVGRGVTLVPRVSQHDYVANVLAAAESARRRGAAVVLLGPVYRDAVTNPPEAKRMHDYRAALRGTAEDARLPYLELPELTERAAATNLLLFGELIHPNHLGHRLMAERLLAFMAQRGMLARIAVPNREQRVP